jgi:general secretion pathway protein B
MSFILDALKKSEDARLRQAGPSLADAPARRRRTERPWWAIAVAALLLVNMVVLGIVLARGKNGPKATAVEPAHQSTPQAQAAPSPVSTVDAGQSAGAVEPATAQPTPVVQSARAALESPAEPVTQMQPITGPSVAPAIVTAPQPTASSASPTFNSPAPAAAPVAQSPPPPQRSLDNLPTANEVASRGSVPPLHLDLHVYAANSPGRFVFINNRKYQEGQTITEGPIVEEITPDGVILSSNGQRFMLPRQ